MGDCPGLLDSCEFPTSDKARLFGPIGNIPPVEFEALYYERQETPAIAVGLT